MAIFYTQNDDSIQKKRTSLFHIEVKSFQRQTTKWEMTFLCSPESFYPTGKFFISVQTISVLYVSGPAEGVQCHLCYLMKSKHRII